MHRPSSAAFGEIRRPLEFARLEMARPWPMCAFPPVCHRCRQFRSHHRRQPSVVRKRLVRSMASRRSNPRCLYPDRDLSLFDALLRPQSPIRGFEALWSMHHSAQTPDAFLPRPFACHSRRTAGEGHHRRRNGFCRAMKAHQKASESPAEPGMDLPHASRTQVPELMQRHDVLAAERRGKFRLVRGLRRSPGLPVIVGPDQR